MRLLRRWYARKRYHHLLVLRDQGVRLTAAARMELDALRREFWPVRSYDAEMPASVSESAGSVSKSDGGE